MNRYIKATGILTFLFTAVFLWGCDQSPMTTEPATAPAVASTTSGVTYVVNGKPTAAGRDVNQKLEALSKAVAKALADEEVRMRFLKAAMKKFDGETNVLWMDLALSTKQPVLSAARAADAPGLSSTQGIGMAVSRAGDALGGPLHLYWAFAENFDGSRAPWVTFTPMGVDADKITDIEAFDAEGDVHVVNEQVAKKRPVVVITGNERTDAQGNLLSASEGVYGGVGTNRICLPNEDPPGCEEPPVPEPCPTCGGDVGDDDDGEYYIVEDLPPRENSDTEYLYAARAMYCPEGWPNGDCEYYFVILDEDNDPVEDILLDHESPYPVPVTALDSIGEWIVFERDIFVWQTNDEGDHVVVSWYERDNQFQDGGPDPMGFQTINFDDPSDTIYCDGDCGIEWTHSWE